MAGCCVVGCRGGMEGRMRRTDYGDVPVLEEDGVVSLVMLGIGDWRGKARGTNGHCEVNGTIVCGPLRAGLEDRRGRRGDGAASGSMSSPAAAACRWGDFPARTSLRAETRRVDTSCWLQNCASSLSTPYQGEYWTGFQHVGLRRFNGRGRPIQGDPVQLR